MAGEADDKGKGEGTGASTDGKGAGAEQPKYVTIEDLNRALSGRDKRLLASIKKTFTSGAPKGDEADEGDDEAETTTVPAKKPSKGSAASATTPAAASGSDDPRFQDLEARLAKSEKEREKEKRARAEEKAAGRKAEERTKLSEALTAAGITGPKLRAAIAILHTEDARVKRGEEDSIVFVDGDDEIDLGEGVKRWLATEDGKAFLPPRGAKGAGTERSRLPGAAATDPKSQRKEAANALFAKAFRGGVS